MGGYCVNNMKGTSSIHISPNYTNADLVYFRAVAGHELIHSYHYFCIPTVLNNYSESIAYNYTFNTYYENGKILEALATKSIIMSNRYDFYLKACPVEYSLPNSLLLRLNR